MNFRSIYQHGFVRVAACTGRIAIADPPANAEVILRHARACADDRKLLCRAQSSRCLAAYVYAAAGQGESTTDLSWDGQTTIFENGVLLAETDRFPDGDRRAVADVDLDLLRQERMRMGTFDDNRREHADRTLFRRVPFTLGPPEG